jgi:hypothetical protein
LILIFGFATALFLPAEHPRFSLVVVGLACLSSGSALLLACLFLLTPLDAGQRHRLRILHALEGAKAFPFPYRSMSRFIDRIRNTPWQWAQEHAGWTKGSSV